MSTTATTEDEVVHEALQAHRERAERLTEMFGEFLAADFLAELARAIPEAHPGGVLLEILTRRGMAAIELAKTMTVEAERGAQEVWDSFLVQIEA